MAGLTYCLFLAAGGEGRKFSAYPPIADVGTTEAVFVSKAIPATFQIHVWRLFGEIESLPEMVDCHIGLLTTLVTITSLGSTQSGMEPSLCKFLTMVLQLKSGKSTGLRCKSRQFSYLKLLHISNQYPLLP